MGTPTVNAIHVGAPRRLCGVAVLALVAGLMALGAAPASAAFSRGMTIGASGCCPEVASDADGDAVAVWTHFSDSGSWAVARTISAAREPGPLLRLSGPTLSGHFPTAEVASDADGDAIAVYTRRGTQFHERVKARMISADGVLGAPITLSARGGGAFNPQIASDPAGDAVAVWTRWDGANTRVQARTISRNGALGPIHTLSAAGQNAGSPKVAIDADGDAVVVWGRFRPGTRVYVQAATVSRGGAVGPTRNLCCVGKDAAAPQVTIDREGDAVAVWLSGPDLEAFPPRDWTIEARSISHTGSLGAITRLSEGPVGLPPPLIAGDADGDAVVIWTEAFDPAPDEDFGRVIEQARRISGSGMLGPITALAETDTRQPFLGWDIASDGDGGAVAVSSVGTFVGSCDNAVVTAHAISKADVVGPQTTLADVGEQCRFDARVPQIASDADGDVVVVFEPSGVGIGNAIRLVHGP